MKHDTIRAIHWRDAGLELLDQRYLPEREAYSLLRDSASVAQAIREMVVRGAPAIGITAAYGVVLAAREAYARSPTTWREAVAGSVGLLLESRPTAVNLAWAVHRMQSRMDGIVADPVPILLDEARRIHQEDVAANRHMGGLGAALVDRRCRVITHCNTGSLATGGYGTALGVIRSAFSRGHIEGVYADETRPWLQGARLTAWELVQDGIPVDVIVDGAAAHVMRRGGVSWVIVGSDRIAANGDVANKIGTYGLAVNARHHGVRFMVVAPTSTIDMELPDGGAIPIETRSSDEVLTLAGTRVAAPGAGAFNPAFDVTPAGLVDAVVTERGVVFNPDREKMTALMENHSRTARD